MPYLDWSTGSVQVHVQETRPGSKTLLRLEISRDEAESLMSFLEGLFVIGQASDSPQKVAQEFAQEFGLELRLSLPHGWTLFWKRREEGSLALMAHPEAEEWVGTLALDMDFGIQILRLLRELKENGTSFSLNQGGAIRSVSNLDVQFARRENEI